MKNPKMFVIKKYVMAKSAKEALRLEKHQEADDCWVEEGWAKMELEKAFEKTK